MLRFLFTRLLTLIPAFVGVTLITFFMVRLIPGDPVLLLAGERGLSPERHAQLMAQLGLDGPILNQYLGYIWRILQGDLGRSISTRTPIFQEFFTLFPATIELSICGLAFAIAVGIPAGILAATRRGSMLDYSVMGIALTGYSMPIFWWAVLAIILFSVGLGWTPVAGRLDFIYFIPNVTGFMLIDTLIAGNWGAFKNALHHLVLPAIVLGTVPLAVIARMTRSAMLEVLGEDYVRTARAKGLRPRRIVWLHALRNALIPVITVIGLQVSVLFTGAILTETMFSWPGIGKWMVEAINRRDYPVIQGGVLMIATTVLIVNLSVDLVYGVVNPRIRHRR